MRTLADLGLRGYPFRVAPDEEYLRHWADRRDTYDAINKKVAAFTTTTPSEVLFLWGYFGTGKSHALRHFGFKMSDQGSGLVVFTDLLGCNPDSFLSVYLEVARGVKFDSVSESLARLLTKASLPHSEARQVLRAVVRDSSSDLLGALAGLCGSDSQKDAAVAWFQGSTLSRSDKEAIAVRDKLKTDSQALGAIGGLHDVLRADGRFLAIMFDEYQTLAELADSRMMRIQQGLVGLYNRCPQGLLMVLSFTGRQEGAVYHLIPDSLLQRAPPDARIKMPPMTRDDAQIFVRDLLTIYRTKGVGGVNLYYPFTEDGIDTIVSRITARKEPLTPRSLNLAMEQVIQSSLVGDARPPLDRAAVEKLVPSKGT